MSSIRNSLVILEISKVDVVVACKLRSSTFGGVRDGACSYGFGGSGGRGRFGFESDKAWSADLLLDVGPAGLLFAIES